MAIVPSSEQVTGLILAGGQGRRMHGQDKGLINCAGRPLIAYAIEALRPVCDQILINANRSLASYQAFGFPVISDCLPGFQGPLAGILTALRAANTPYLVTIPCDSPCLKSSTLQKLLEALICQRAKIACAHDGLRSHPVILALRTDLAEDLASYLAKGEHKIDRWIWRHPWAKVDFSDCPGQFANINTVEELEALRTLLENPHERS